MTDAERRAKEVRARRAPRPPRTADHERAAIESRTVETWVDEGSIRDEADRASRRARSSTSSPAPRRRRSGVDAEIAATVGAELAELVGAERGRRLADRLAQASDALDRGRYDEAKRVAGTIAREVPGLAAAHEIVGLADYRLGRYKSAAKALSTAKDLHLDAALLPVLADCYRALRRWAAVERTWAELKDASPSHEVMAEGRIVAASAQADRGDLRAALATMASAKKVPKRVRLHHLREWYVIADLYDRLGEPIEARRWFQTIARHDADFADVDERLRTLGV
jgi:tetratricopeptide (TPR) repeat protein